MKAIASALATAVLFGLAARLEWFSPLAAAVALAPWLAGLERATTRAAFASAAAAAVAVTASAFFWFPPAVAAYAHVRPAIAWACVLALAPVVVQPQFLAACACRLVAKRVGATPASTAVVTAFAYVGAEWALPKPLADTLGIGLFPSAALRQWAEFGGAAGLTAICAGCAACLAAAITRRRWRPAAWALAVVVAAALAGELRLRSVRRDEQGAPAYHAGVVQAAITAYDKLAAERGTYGAVRAILDAHFALSAKLLAEGPIDLLVWPETVYPTTYGAPKSDDGAELDREIAALPAQSGVPLVLGAFEDTGRGEHNAAFFLRPDGRFATYQKSMLFPMTEHVPAWIDSAALRSAFPWTGRWTPGRGAATVPVTLADGTAIRVAPLICYEALHAAYAAREAREGADLILTLSNDGWFGDDAAPRLHLAGAALRSVELRLPQIRATNSGISALVLPSGDLIRATNFGAATAVRLDVPRVPRAWTPVLAWGNWLPPSCAAACTVLIVAARLARQRAPRPLELARDAVGNPDA